MQIVPSAPVYVPKEPLPVLRRVAAVLSNPYMGADVHAERQAAISLASTRVQMTI